MATITGIGGHDDRNTQDALYSALFHTISAFNNAGISLYENSLTRYVEDPVTILTITILVILGGIGFTVLTDVGATRSWAKLRPYTKIILLGTLALNLLGFFFIWALEFNNPDTLAPLSIKGQALAAWLQSIATRTAGFSSVDISQLSDSTTLIMILFMFIGGGSLSTASGIKLGTFIVLLAAAYSYIAQRNEVMLLKRSISQETIQKSLALLLVTMGLGFIATVVISIFDKVPLINIMFEVVAALSTTGLGRNLTPNLSTTSQTILLVLMFVGRIGPLTLVYSIATQGRSRIRYPETEIQVG
ncbi:MAG TPA: potassium transporter TrkG [Eoetvoesiella sp.]